MKKLIISAILLFASAITVVNAQWSLTGNAGTDTLTKFIGTTDNVPLKIKTNNQQRMILLTNGRVGIGTVNPQFNLDVTSTTASVTMGIKSTTAGATMSMDRGTTVSNAAFAYKSLGTSLWNSGLIGNDNFTIRNVATLTNALVINPTNNIGIGTGSPTQKLEVTGTIYSNAGGFKFPDGTTQLTAAASGANLQLSNLSATAINAALIPNSNNSKDLGSALNGWKDIYLASKIYIGGTSFIKNTGSLCIGSYAGNSSTGNYNVFIGSSSGFANTTGTSNIILGADGGTSNTTGNENTFIGDYVGSGNVTGSQNTLIGAGADVSSASLVNATAIGYGAVVNSSNSVILGNNAQVGIGTSSPEAQLHLNSNSSIATPQLLLYENENDFARLNFKNSTSSSYWTIAGLNSATNLAERLNFYNSTSGDVMSLTGNGSVCIGTGTPAAGYKLSVNGKIICEEMKVQLHANWPDYVFGKSYELLSLREVEKFTNLNGHLPGIPSATDIKNIGGIELGMMQTKLLEKIEELTLYLIKQDKELELLKNKLFHK